jgi:hypothetical protein
MLSSHLAVPAGRAVLVLLRHERRELTQSIDVVDIGAFRLQLDALSGEVVDEIRHLGVEAVRKPRFARGHQHAQRGCAQLRLLHLRAILERLPDRL